MSTKKLVEDTQKNEVTSPITQNPDLYNRQIAAKPKPKPKIGIDVDQEFYDILLNAALANNVDIGKLESFSQISNNRNQVYNLIDTMAEDSTVAAILETYAEDATETNQDGRVVWAESLQPEIAKYITYLLDIMNVDKNAYKWIYSLTKYGDLYLRLYRESEYNDKLFDSDNSEEQNKHAQSKKLNEDLSKAMAGFYDTEDAPTLDVADSDDTLTENLGMSNSTNILNEDVHIKVYSVNDKFVHYLEAIPNPAEIYELTRLGKSYAYILAPSSIGLNKYRDVMLDANRYSYKFKKKDVNLYEATEFVHAALEDNSSRVPEEVNIFLNDNDYDSSSNALTYTVRRGQSILYNAYKIWRELMLLEYALLLNRVTKSSIVRIIGVEVGDMPKELIGPHLAGIKSLMEQKSAINVGSEMNEYTNPGPIENNIYVPTHEGVGNISAQTLGGDVDVKGLADIDYFKNKFFGAMKVPKQFFGDTDDAAGFDAGTSLSIISSRYAKTIKRIQNTFILAITDAINLMLIDKGLTSYVNKFELHMVPPTTRDDIDRQDNISSRIQLANDVMLLVGDLPDLGDRLKILKAMLGPVVNEPVVGEVIQDEIDRLEELKQQGIALDENGQPIEQEDMTGMTGEFGGDFGGDMSGGDAIDFGSEDSSDFSTESAEDSSLPTPDSLGLDLTNNE